MSSPSTTSGFSVEAPISSGNSEAGPEIGEQAERLAQPQQAGAGPHRRRDGFVARNAGGAEQHGVGLAGELERRLRAAGRRRRRCRPADRRLGQFQRRLLPTTAFSTLTACAVTSGPMPSPGITSDLHAILHQFGSSAGRRSVRHLVVEAALECRDGPHLAQRVVELVEAFSRQCREKGSIANACAVPSGAATVCASRSTSTRLPGRARIAAAVPPTAAAGSRSAAGRSSARWSRRCRRSSGAITARKP